MEQQPVAVNDEPKGLYADHIEALKAVVADYQYWTGRLTETSAQMSYAVIAANWIVFGSVNVILRDSWAKFSLLFVLLSLATSVISTWLLSEGHKRQAEYGDSDPRRWKSEFDALADTKAPWPFTAFIISTAAWSRNLKALFVLLGGALLVIGTVLKPPA